MDRLDNIILVTGALRSGISIVGGVISLCGAWSRPDALKACDGRGLFENSEINESVIKPFLRGIKADPGGQNPLPNIDLCKELAEKLYLVWRRRIEKIIMAQERQAENMPVVLVSSNICLIWPMWAKAFPSAEWVIVRRRDEDIIRSCMQTGYMTGYRNKKGWQGWIEKYKQRFLEINSAGFSIHQIWPNRMFGGKLAEMKSLIDALNLRWDNDAVEDFIAPIVWKNGIFEIQKC